LAGQETYTGGEAGRAFCKRRVSLLPAGAILMPALAVRIQGTSLVVAAILDVAPTGLEVDPGRFHANGENVKCGPGRYGPACSGFQRTFPGWNATDYVSRNHGTSIQFST
jgi:hypothetical protein